MSDNEEDRKEEEGSGAGWLIAAGVLIGAAASAVGYFVGKSSAEGPQCSVSRTQQSPPSQTYRNSVVTCSQCSICLDDMDVAVLPCKHAFHKKCIAQWFKISNICPTCRTPVRHNIAH